MKQLLLGLLLLPGVLGLGLSYEYMEGNTLRLAPGESYYFKLILQNEEPDAVQVEIVLDSPYATLVGGDHVQIPGSTFDKFVYFNISVPQEAEPGSQLTIPYSVKPVSDEEGQVTFGVKYDRHLTVTVEGPDTMPENSGPPSDLDQVIQPERSKTLIVVLLLLVIFATIALLLWRKKSEKH